MTMVYKKKLLEKKYYTIEGLLKVVCDGNEEKAEECLSCILKVLEEYEPSERFFQTQKMMLELNILLKYKAHAYKVNALICEKTCNDFQERIEKCKTNRRKNKKQPPECESR